MRSSELGDDPAARLARHGQALPPLVDNRERTLRYYLAGAEPAQPLASPLFADLTGFPPLLVMVGPDETHVDDCEELAKRAAGCGVDATLEIVDGAFHTWLGYADTVHEAAASVERIGAFVAAHAAQ